MIVTPVYNEEANIDRYAEEVARVLFSDTNLDATVLFVDDGSSDRSWQKLAALTQASSRFSAIRLSRNFGSHLALAAGFDSIGDDADAVAVLACDLQDPPQTILDFVQAWRDGADIVWGQRRSRADEGWRRHASMLLESMVRRYAMPRHSRFTTGSFLLMDRKVLACVQQFREQSRVTFALVAWTGFDQAVVPYDRQPRRAGRSGWRFGQMLNTAYDVLIGFSPVPAKLITALGLGMFGVSLLLLAYLLLSWAFSNVLPGWTGVMATMTTFFGILFVMLGVIAEYLHRIFVEAKNRPLYFVAARIGQMHEATEPHGE
ncbi:MAG TPA: glycosyltransferase family 2 protein [Acetobacteraceae bacterium]|nr:glycosyltransferase family 2 protein [Acetobacteraceae bacterium]